MKRLAYEAADTELLSPDLAAGIRRVKGAKRIGVRLDVTSSGGHHVATGLHIRVGYRTLADLCLWGSNSGRGAPPPSEPPTVRTKPTPTSQNMT